MTNTASFSRAVFIQEIPRQHPTQSSFPWRVAEVKTPSGFYSTTPASRLLIYQHYYLRNDIFFIKTKCTRTQSVQTSAVLSPLRCDYFYNVRNVLHQLRKRRHCCPVCCYAKCCDNSCTDDIWIKVKVSSPLTQSDFVQARSFRCR